MLDSNRESLYSSQFILISKETKLCMRSIKTGGKAISGRQGSNEVRIEKLPGEVGECGNV